MNLRKYGHKKADIGGLHHDSIKRSWEQQPKEAPGFPPTYPQPPAPSPTDSDSAEKSGDQ